MVPSVSRASDTANATAAAEGAEPSVGHRMREKSTPRSASAAAGSHHDRARRLAKDLLGDRTEQEVLHAAAAVRSQHNQVDALAGLRGSRVPASRRKPLRRRPARPPGPAHAPPAFRNRPGAAAPRTGRGQSGSRRRATSAESADRRGAGPVAPHSASPARWHTARPSPRPPKSPLHTECERRVSIATSPRDASEHNRRRTLWCCAARTNADDESEPACRGDRPGSCEDPRSITGCRRGYFRGAGNFSR